MLKLNCESAFGVGTVDVVVGLAGRQRAVPGGVSLGLVLAFGVHGHHLSAGDARVHQAIAGGRPSESVAEGEEVLLELFGAAHEDDRVRTRVQVDGPHTELEHPLLHLLRHLYLRQEEQTDVEGRPAGDESHNYNCDDLDQLGGGAVHVGHRVGGRFAQVVEYESVTDGNDE